MGFRTLRLGRLQELIELWHGPGIGNDLLPPLVGLLGEQKADEIRHLGPLGLRESLTNVNQFARFRAHAIILRARCKPCT